MEAMHNRCTDGSSMSVTAAPFVLKTYRIVNDPSTDSMIAWGRCNNSFVVVDLFGFCMHLLPSHFKHSNFSSFVRQLNTYGFRKVDPDRWEFAHESFLRGQTHLLHLIVRRNSTSSNRGAFVVKEEDLEAEAEELERMVAEVEKLKQEQRATGEEMRRIWARLQETERKPRQMLAFLLKVVQNPQLLPRLSRTSIDVNREEDDHHHHRLRGEGYADYDDSLEHRRKRPLVMFSSAAADPPPLALPHCPSTPPGEFGKEHLPDVPMESVMTPEDNHCAGGTHDLRAFPQYVSLNDVGDEVHHQPCLATDGILPSIFAGEHVADGWFHGQCLLMPELGWDGDIDSGAFPWPQSFSAGARF